MIVHAGLIALRLGGRWRGVLIEGPSGVGKSDLALRALDAGFRLVADDRVQLWTSGGRLFGRAPDTLAGLIEARGLGVVAEPALAYAAIGLVAVCEPVERVPPRRATTRLGVELPQLSVAPLEASTAAKIGRALEQLGREPQEAYQAQLVARILPRSGRDSR